MEKGMEKIAYEFCGTVGDFVYDNFDQVVIRLEEGYNWTGDLAIVCPDCRKKYDRDELKQTLDGREVLSKSRRDRAAKGWAYAEGNQADTFSIFKPRYGEGDRWVAAEKEVAQRRKEREEQRARGYNPKRTYIDV